MATGTRGRSDVASWQAPLINLASGYSHYGHFIRYRHPGNRVLGHFKTCKRPGLETKTRIQESELHLVPLLLSD